MNAETLYDIQAELDQIQAALDHFEETGEDESVILAVNSYFADLSTRRDEKLEAYASLIHKHKAAHLIRKTEATRLSDLAKVDENKMKRLQGMLKAVWEAHGLTSVSTKYHEFGRQNHGGVLALVIDPSIEMEPELAFDEHTQVIVQLDKETIRADLEEGVEVPYAALAERGWSVRIR